jgi:hypothetical protein
MEADTVRDELKRIHTALVYCDVSTRSGHCQQIFISTDRRRERIHGKGKGKPITGLDSP